MTIANTLAMEGIVGVLMIVVGFYLWFFLSKFLISLLLSLEYFLCIMLTNFPPSIAIAILVCMEGTSAMLHSLRLAWVESFSKFAEFAGWPFAPFSFDVLFEESEELKEFLG